jgi:hypothetical protein
MSDRLFSLFDEKLRRPEELVASPPQSLDSLSSKLEEQQYIVDRFGKFSEVIPRVDYSNFANFVFFNSALDYFNITGEKILNEYPYDGTRADRQAFIDDLDGYQNHVLDTWPKRSGHIRFDSQISSSYILCEDVGVDSGVARTGMLSPGTSSLSLEFWCIPPPVLTGSSAVMVLAQKVTGSGDGYSVYFSGSRAYFRMVSGSNSTEISTLVNPGTASYFSCVYDNSSFSTPFSFIYTGSIGSFPVLVSSSSSGISGPIFVGSTKISFASGSISGKNCVPFSGALDNVRIWNVPLSVFDISSSFNCKIFSQRNLTALWRFNETGSSPTNSNIVLDYSGHRLNGRIFGYYPAMRASGSLVPFEDPDPILSFDSPEIQALISVQQASGSAYDRSNDNIITRMLPSQLFQLEQLKNTDVLEKFIYILARNFDEIKTRIDQTIFVLRSKYGEFDQTPDALLEDIGKQFGWEFTANFLSADASQYILGKNVLHNTEANREIDTKLFQIKNEFWKRTLINLVYLYKTKGTRESVESLLRIYGVNKNFVKLKEFGFKPIVGISTNRINSQKSVFTVQLGSGSFTGSHIVSPSFSSSFNTVESRVKFPTTGTLEMPATLSGGLIWSLKGNASQSYQMSFLKNALGSQTGSLIMSSSEGTVILSGANIFDNEWYNVSFLRDPASSSFFIDVRSIDDDAVSKRFRTQTIVSGSISSSLSLTMTMGASGSTPTQMWVQEMRVWNQALSDAELDDHALNFQSYGTEEFQGSNDLALHWRLNEGLTADGSGSFTNIYDYSAHNLWGTGSGFLHDSIPFTRFLLDYNYIAAPDLGWNEEKVRVFDSSSPDPGDAFLDNRVLSLEFGMIDALNEDISQIISTMDDFNIAIGLPVNRFRATYHDLEILRFNYFRRLQGRLNFRVFSDMLEFFDRSFLDMVRRLIPARTVFLGDEFVIESHMLERPKLQWNYRRQQAPFQPEGVIQVYIRT